MRNIVFLVALATAATAMAGQRAEVNFLSTEAVGYFILTPTDRVAYVNVTNPAQGGAGDSHIRMQHFDRDRLKTTIILGIEAAARLDHEAEPFLMLYERGRKFNESFAVSDSVGAELVFGKDLRLTVIDRSQNARIVYRNDVAVTFLRGLRNAREVSKTWVRDAMGGRRPPHRPPAGPPSAAGLPRRPPTARRLPCPSAPTARWAASPSTT